MGFDLEGNWFWGPAFKAERLTKEYLDIRSKKYDVEMEILEELGYIQCPQCSKTKPYYDFVHSGSFGSGNYLKCICGHRWGKMFPQDDMVTRNEYYKRKNK